MAKRDLVDEYLLCLMEDKPIPEEIASKVERWSHADDLLRKHGPGKRAQKIHVAKYPKLSINEVYKDFESAQRIFGTIDIRKKQYWRTMGMELIIQDIHTARTNNEFKILPRLYDQLRKFAGLDSEDDRMFEELSAKIKAPVNIIGYFPEQFGGKNYSKEEKAKLLENLREKYLNRGRKITKILLDGQD